MHADTDVKAVCLIWPPSNMNPFCQQVPPDEKSKILVYRSSPQRLNPQRLDPQQLIGVN